MRALCKKNHDRFKEGNWYNYHISYISGFDINGSNIIDSKEKFACVDDGLMIIWFGLSLRLEMNFCFYDYFYTEKEIRLLKLKQINESVM